jgi:hypothetical protein
MKELKSPTMKLMLERGLRKAKRTSPPSEGMMLSLINETKKNRWHYQVEYVYDLRMRKNPYVIAYAFKPQTYGSADYYLMKELPPKK